MVTARNMATSVMDFLPSYLHFCDVVLPGQVASATGIFALRSFEAHITVKMKPLEFPAIWHANAEITQFIWKIPCKCFHKKIC